MRVRIKFTKNGPVKFIGHLDVMRYFQKAMRRAEIPVALSGGFSPHMLMSFAAPLGVGITSDGEYFDVDLTEEIPSEELVRRLNAQMAEGILVKNAVRIGETKADKGMTVVAAAEYTVRFRPGKFRFAAGSTGEEKAGIRENSNSETMEGHRTGDRSASPEELFRQFLARDSIIVMRKTKRSEAETDIRPWIYSASMLRVMTDDVGVAAAKAVNVADDADAAAAKAVNVADVTDKSAAADVNGADDIPEAAADVNAAADTDAADQDGTSDPADASRYAFHMLLSSGSVHNLKPELVIQAFASDLGIEIPEFSMMIHRNDVYANAGTEEEPKFVPLDALGERI